ncbi:MAG: hypothetical protein FWD04_06635 [Conexibacteraceae bacterium]|nr:hypothetical protein [Conexibacteraceae bacterium]
MTNLGITTPDEGAPAGAERADGLTDTPEDTPGGGPSRMTLTEAAEATGLPRRNLESRIERGQLRAVRAERNGKPVRLVPVSELERLGLLTADGEPGPSTPQVVEAQGRELIVWRQVAEQEKARADDERARVDELQNELRQAAAELAVERQTLAQERGELSRASAWGALRLRREARQKLDQL